MPKYRCTICGYIHEEISWGFVCPRCKNCFLLKSRRKKQGKNPYEQNRKNLMEAFAGESQARNKYTYFAHIAQRRLWTISWNFLNYCKKRTRTCTYMVWRTWGLEIQL